MLFVHYLKQLVLPSPTYDLTQTTRVPAVRYSSTISNTRLTPLFPLLKQNNNTMARLRRNSYDSEEDLPPIPTTTIINSRALSHDNDSHTQIEHNPTPIPTTTLTIHHHHHNDDHNAPNIRSHRGKKRQRMEVEPPHLDNNPPLRRSSRLLAKEDELKERNEDILSIDEPSPKRRRTTKETGQFTKASTRFLCLASSLLPLPVYVNWRERSKMETPLYKKRWIITSFPLAYLPYRAHHDGHHLPKPHHALLLLIWEAQRQEPNQEKKETSNEGGRLWSTVVSSRGKRAPEKKRETCCTS